MWSASGQPAGVHGSFAVHSITEEAARSRFSAVCRSVSGFLKVVPTSSTRHASRRSANTSVTGSVCSTAHVKSGWAGSELG